jgi:D-alanine-D-alanine ligase
MSKLRVAVIYGGRSAEHEISLLSARFVVASLDRERFEPVLVGIDKDGRWSMQTEEALLSAPADPKRIALERSAAHTSPAPWPTAEGARWELAAIGAAPVTTLAAAEGIDVVFPVLHGPMGEDGTVQGLLALAGVPHVGAGVLGSAVGMDKDVMKRLLQAERIPIVPHRVLRMADWERGRDAVLTGVQAAIALPAFVKPANLGSSVGVSKAKSAEQLARGIDDAFRWDTKVIVEQGLAEVRELECAVLGNDEPLASRVGEIVVTHADGFYSYDAKYVDAAGSEARIPADVPPSTEARIRELAVRTFRALECEGLARVDVFLSRSGEVYVNEINTLPGFTSISMFPKLWEASGIDAKALVSKLVDLALERAARRAKLRTCV